MTLIPRSTLLATTVLTMMGITGATAADKLTIYTYDSFVADWGPGPKVEEAFEATCNCDVEFVGAADGVALLNRLRLEGERTDADIVLGLDTNLLADAKATGLFAPHGLDLTARYTVPGGFLDDTFVPFDYGFFAIVYDTQTIPNPPTSMEAFLNADPSLKIAVQDPRTSTPGLGLMLWLKELYGEQAPAAYAKLAERTLTVTPGWSEAYGLFTDGEVPMVLSYTTSPAYHMIAEEEGRYQAMAFEEGHYMQIEVAAQTTKGSDNPLAAQFLDFMTSPAFQSIIPETNWMMPAAATGVELNPVFDKLVTTDKPLLMDSETVALNRADWVAEWLEAMSR